MVLEHCMLLVHLMLLKSDPRSWLRLCSASETFVSKKKVEEVMPIVTGLEREEIEAELQGRKVINIDNPEDSFGTKLHLKASPSAHQGGFFKHWLIQLYRYMLNYVFLGNSS